MKKVMLKFHIPDCARCNNEALKRVGKLNGIDRIAFNMNNKMMTVIGDVDPVDIVMKLRRFCRTEIVSVTVNIENRRGDEDNGDDDGGGGGGGGGGGRRRRGPDSDRGRRNSNSSNNMKSDPSGDKKSSDNSGNFQQLGGYQQWRKNAKQNRMLIILLLCFYYFKLSLQQRSTALLRSVSAPLRCCNMDLISTAANIHFTYTYAGDAN